VSQAVIVQFKSGDVWGRWGSLGPYLSCEQAFQEFFRHYDSLLCEKPVITNSGNIDCKI
jgi:hypothetical protein